MLTHEHTQRIEVCVIEAELPCARDLVVRPQCAVTHSEELHRALRSMLVTSSLRIRLPSSFGRRQDCIEQLALGLGDESRSQLAAKRAPHLVIGSVSAI